MRFLVETGLTSTEDDGKARGYSQEGVKETFALFLGVKISLEYVRGEIRRVEVFFLERGLTCSRRAVLVTVPRQIYHILASTMTQKSQPSDRQTRRFGRLNDVVRRLADALCEPNLVSRYFLFVLSKFSEDRRDHGLCDSKLLSWRAGWRTFLLSHRIHCCCFAGHVLNICMRETHWQGREGASTAPPTPSTASTHVQEEMEAEKL
jgi:hypothetical protein